MAWYWWVLIAVACIAFYILKVIVLRKFQKQSKIKREQKERDMENNE